MTTITVSDDQGQLMVTVDGGEPQPVQNAEDACQIIEQTFGQAEEDPMAAAQAGYAKGAPAASNRPTAQAVFGEGM